MTQRFGKMKVNDVKGTSSFTMGQHLAEKGSKFEPKKFNKDRPAQINTKLIQDQEPFTDYTDDLDGSPQCLDVDLDAIFADLAIEEDENMSPNSKSVVSKTGTNLSLLANMGDDDYHDKGFKIKLSPIMFIDL